MPISLNSIRHVALDMDGTIYKGETLFDCTKPFLKLLGELGITHSFLTNNPSKSQQTYLAHLKKLGIEAKPEELYTSAQATIEYLQAKHPAIKKLFLLGTDDLAHTFKAAGYSLTTDDPKDAPDAVMVSFDTTLTYSRLCRAAWWISRGKPYFGTNPDQTCPTDKPTVLVDCGSILACLEKATGQSPVAVLGKPDVAMLDGILRRLSIQPNQLAMVGDRLYTDIAMAQRAGALSVLVLTGETTAEGALQHRPAPDLTLFSLAEFGDRLVQAHQSKTK